MLPQPRHPELTVVDWNLYSRSHPDWFQPDGLHLDSDGALAMATLVHRSLDELGLVAAPPVKQLDDRDEDTAAGPGRPAVPRPAGRSGGARPLTWSADCGRAACGRRAPAGRNADGDAPCRRPADRRRCSVTDAQGRSAPAIRPRRPLTASARLPVVRGLPGFSDRLGARAASIPAMPLAISILYFLPFIILGVALILMLVLFLLARIQNGRFLRPIVTQLSKIPFMRRWFQKMSVAAYERSNPELAGAIKKMQSFGEIKTPEQAQRALAVMTPAERKAYMELVGEQGQMPEPVNRDQRRRVERGAQGMIVQQRPGASRPQGQEEVEPARPCRRGRLSGSGRRSGRGSGRTARARP